VRLQSQPKFVEQARRRVIKSEGTMTKRLVVCCDGTWNTANQEHATNVTKFALSIAAADEHGVEQRVFYDPGVGSSRAERLRGGIFGVGLSKNVQDAYRFIVETYTPGDELYFVGFSRGAFTARSTAGLVRNAGILRPAHASQVEEAYKLYRSKTKATEPGQREAILFRRSYSHPDTDIKFIGVWDTVGALGIPTTGLHAVKLINSQWAFHDTTLSRTVKNAYHALAIDEARRPFEPTLWETQPDAPEDQHVEQVWFCGVHSNIGGGYPNTSLADIALLWMVNKARSCDLAFDDNAFGGPPRVTVAPDPWGKLENSTKFVYRLNDRPRTIGNPKYAVQSIASTAVERQEKDPTYAPPSLLTYLSGPNPRITNV
jgi:uncharacterized protein (DUF2235 family)